jgi:hypothetical protein
MHQERLWGRIASGPAAVSSVRRSCRDCTGSGERGPKLRLQAYASAKNFDEIAKHGVTPYIPFRAGTTGDRGGLFAKAFHYFNLYRDQFLSHYHKRSNVEAAIGAIKAKFGDAVRSKTDLAMKKEVLCKVLCHNLTVLIGAMHELGITPDFATAPTVPTGLRVVAAGG